MKEKLKSIIKQRYTIRANLILFVLLVFIATTIINGFVFSILLQYKIITPKSGYRFVIIVLLVSCIIIGTALSAVTSKWMLKPYKELIEATKEIAAGNFDIRLKMEGAKEIEQLSENFNQMAKDLAIIETMRNDFVSNVSHEFKTPVSCIKGFAKLLKRDTLSVDIRKEYLDIIIKESERLSRLSGKVLLLSKLEKQDKIKIIEKSRFSLDEQLRQVVLLLEPEWKRKNITVDVNLDTIICLGNEELLEEVWTNLLGNAIKFTDQNGKIDITLYKEHANIVKISDSGKGMDEETCKHIFDKFYQGDESRTTEGNGLGLVLVKKIVELSEGKIKVESKVNQGTTFYIYLPE